MKPIKNENPRFWVTASSVEKHKNKWKEKIDISYGRVGRRPLMSKRKEKRRWRQNVIISSSATMGRMDFLFIC